MDFPEVIYVWDEESDWIVKATYNYICEGYIAENTRLSCLTLEGKKQDKVKYWTTLGKHVCVKYQTSLEECLKYRKKGLMGRIKEIRIKLSADPKTNE